MQINIKRGRLKTANRLFRQMTLPVVFGLLSLSAGQTWANSGVAGRFVQCTATVQGNGTFKGHPALVFGSQSNGINLLNNNQPEDIQATIHYQCINNDDYTVKVRLCFNIDGGEGLQTYTPPEKWFIAGITPKHCNYPYLNPITPTGEQITRQTLPAVSEQVSCVSG